MMVSKALVVGMAQRKLEELAALPGMELYVAVPPYWREKGHDWTLERSFTAGYTLNVLPMRLNGHYHLHFYPGLGALLDGTTPEILHFDDEAYNLGTWLALRSAKRRRVKFAFFNWQNIPRAYPPPFSWMEADVFRRADLGIAGNEDAAAIIRDKGFRGAVEVVPQFGIDPDLFCPEENSQTHDCKGSFVIGFVGRLIRAKGLGVLMTAAAALANRDWRIRVVGTGPDRAEFEQQAGALQIRDRVEFVGHVTSTSMPSVMRGFDVLAGPSLTTARWKEQFGRMLTEAMACGVPVIGSDSGEIPRVIGSAGLVVREGDVDALRGALACLQADPALRLELGRLGRDRTLARFTQHAVAERTMAAYQRVMRT
jgi:glycosyltransferase involved in cell wall biosynthesis